MISGVKKNINGKVFEFWTLPPKEALRILTKLSKIIVPGFAKGIGNVSNDKLLDTQIDLGSMAGTIVNNLDENEMLYIIEQLLLYTKITKDGGLKNCNLETDFQGKLGLLVNVIKESIEVNYKDFFTEAVGIIGTRRQT